MADFCIVIQLIFFLAAKLHISVSFLRLSDNDIFALNIHQMNSRYISLSRIALLWSQ